MKTYLTQIKNPARALSLVAGLVLALLPAHAFLTTWVGSNLGHLNTWRLWKEALCLLVALPLGLWLTWHDAKLRQHLKKSWLVRLISLYGLLTLIMAAWALKRHQSTRTAAALGADIDLRFLGFFLICQVAAASDGLLKKYWAKLTLWPAAIVVLFGLAQKFILPLNFLSHFGYGTKTIPAYQTVDANSGPARLQSSLRGPNPLGAYLVLAMPAWRAVFERRRLLAYVGLAAGLVVLFYSYSRSALLAALGCLIVLAIWLAGRSERKLIVLVLIIMAAASGSYLYTQRNSHFVQESLLHTSSNSTSTNSSNFVRRAALRAGWHDLVKQPLGRGPGTAGPASEHNQPHKARIAENYYLQVGQELGVMGLLIFLAINILVALQLWASRRDVLAKVLLVTLAGISLVNLVSHAWADDTLGMLWWGLAGVSLAPILKSKNNV